MFFRTGSQWESDSDLDEDVPDGAHNRVSFSQQPGQKLSQRYSPSHRQPEQHRIPYAEDDEDSEWDSARFATIRLKT